MNVHLFQDEGVGGQGEGHRPVIKGPAGAPREKTPPFSRFARDSWRQSLGNQPNMFRWLEAQERQEDRIKHVGDVNVTVVMVTVVMGSVVMRKFTLVTVVIVIVVMETVLSWAVLPRYLLP